MIEMAAEFFRMLLDPRLYWVASHVVADFSRTTAAILLTSLWQGLAIAAFLGICLRFAPRITAGLRFALLTVGFGAVVALPFLSMVLRGTAASGGDGGHAAVRAASHPWLVIDGRWSVAFTLLWLGASLWRAVLLAGDVARLRRLWKSAVPLDASGLALPKLTGRRAVALCSTDELERPSVIGFFAPRILIPAWLLERIEGADLGQIVMHECEHLRRGDDWTNLLQKLGLVLFPLSPALLWMERRLCLEREMACDEGVVRRTRSARAYATCLTTLAQHGLTRRVQALSLGAWHRRSELTRRVESLLARKPALRPAVAAGFAVTFGIGLVAGSTELMRCPELIGFAPPAVAPHLQPARENSVVAASSELEGDRVLRPEMGMSSGVKATELRAVLPQRRISLAPALHTRHGAPQPVMRDASPAKQEDARLEFPAPKASTSARAQLTRYEVNAATRSPAGGPQEWVVMTTWEQTETAPTIVSDTADASDSSQAGQARAEQPAARMVVTRLVWRVAPAAVAEDADKDAGDAVQAPAAKPVPTQSAMPAIVPVRGGWLIFRL